MCRAFLYSGAPTPLATLLHGPDNSLVRQAWDPQQLGMLNLGGFGVLAWDAASREPERPFTYRTTTLPMHDRNLEAMAAKVDATCVLAHVRGVPHDTRSEITPTNLHPFSFPGVPWTMAHNGTLAHFERMRSALFSQLRPEIAAHVRGTTDSEMVYALVASALEEAGGAEVGDLAAAIQRTIVLLRAVRTAQGIDVSSSLNLFFTNGRDCVAVRFVFDFGCYPLLGAPPLASAVRFLSLWYTVGERFARREDDWCMSGPPGDTSSVLIASEPLSKNLRGWVEVPEYAMLLARRGDHGLTLDLQQIVG